MNFEQYVIISVPNSEIPKTLYHLPKTLYLYQRRYTFTKDAIGQTAHLNDDTMHLLNTQAKKKGDAIKRNR